MLSIGPRERALCTRHCDPKRFGSAPGPIQSQARQRRCCELVRGARSLRLAQRIVFGFVQALDFAAVEALIPDLQARAEGFGRSQVLDSVPDGLSGRCEPAVVLAAILGALCQKQFCGGCVVDGHAVRRPARLQSRYSYLNSFNVIALSATASRTPRCVSSMIFRATRQTAFPRDQYRAKILIQCTFLVSVAPVPLSNPLSIYRGSRVLAHHDARSNRPLIRSPPTRVVVGLVIPSGRSRNANP
jgi:hypothetical protein